MIHLPCIRATWWQWMLTSLASLWVHIHAFKPLFIIWKNIKLIVRPTRLGHCGAWRTRWKRRDAAASWSSNCWSSFRVRVMLSFSPIWLIYPYSSQRASLIRDSTCIWVMHMGRDQILNLYVWIPCDSLFRGKIELCSLITDKPIKQIWSST